MAAKAGTLLVHKDEILRGVEAWAPVIDMPLLDAALTNIESENVAPPPGLILEALRYGAPADFHTVIIGQDPYYTPGTAQGLCFSAPGLPDSLKRIFGCLDRAHLRRNHGDTRGDLRPWAVQGVLMLNASLTTRLGTARAHEKQWAKFVESLIQRLCTSVEGLHFLLWGNDARRYGTTVERHGHHVHEWTHPSPLADNRLAPEVQFRMCPHFEEVNAALKAAGRRTVCWDNQAPIVAFTDGSCPLNGKSGARAGFAAAIIGGQFSGYIKDPAENSHQPKASIIYGEVEPREYGLVGEHGIRPTSIAAEPTNNRGELMGIVYCLLALLQGRAVGQVEIISDSEISVKTLLEWLPTRLKKGTERVLKNYDLVSIAWALLCRLRAQATSVEITHVRSHQKPPSSTAPARERLLWLGNDMADKHASKPMSEPPDYVIHTVNTPPVLKFA
jgi:uracil-DNA glycosylase